MARRKRDRPEVRKGTGKGVKGFSERTSRLFNASGGSPRLEAPGDDVAGVKRDAKEVRRNEAKLSRPHADDAYDGAVDRRDDPALPQFFPQEKGAQDGQDTGDIVQSNGMQEIPHWAGQRSLSCLRILAGEARRTTGRTSLRPRAPHKQSRSRIGNLKAIFNCTLGQDCATVIGRKCLTYKA